LSIREDSSGNIFVANLTDVSGKSLKLNYNQKTKSINVNSQRETNTLEEFETVYQYVDLLSLVDLKTITSSY
jgi:hypothetical protein